MKVLFLSLAALPLLAQAEFPANEYICHSVSAYAGPGLVWIQSDTQEQAESVAANAEIITLDLTYSQAVERVECVPTSESLSDLTMETFRKRVPR